MYIDKIIKREFLVLIVGIITLISLVIGISYSFFFSIDSSNVEIIKTGDLSITFCNDSSCNDKYDNYGDVIGTITIDNEIKPKNIYPMAQSEALNEYPYIFNIKNTGTLDSTIKIRLIEDNTNYINDNNDYKEHLIIGISNCNDTIDRENVTILNYNSLIDNTLLSDVKLNILDSNTYCLWTWLDEYTPNSVQNSYFVANLDVEAEYIPSK